MKSPDKIKRIARKVIRMETESVKALQKQVNADFVRVVSLILGSKGRVVITGMGKSAIIAQKIVATLNSTGTPAVFMHAGDAVHGDLGTIQQSDIVICISKSGNTPEIKVLVPLLKVAGNTLIALCGNPGSYLGSNADLLLNCSVKEEACPHDLAPTSSTTAQLVMGDALAVCLLECRNFSASDFAKFHPGGSLGKRLYLKVKDLSSQNECPKVRPSDPVKKVILEISAKRLGAAAVVENKKLIGVITDGDLRRMLGKNSSIDKLKARDIMNSRPKTIADGALAVEAMKKLREHNITQLIVTENGKFAGFVHFHDLIREGIL